MDWNKIGKPLLCDPDMCIPIPFRANRIQSTYVEVLNLRGKGGDGWRLVKGC